MFPRPQKATALFTLLLFCFDATLSAQSTAGQTTQEAVQESNLEATPETTPGQSMFQPTHVRSSLAERFVGSMRHPVGFSVGVFEFYTPHYRQTPTGPVSASFTSVQPRIFTNFRRSRSEFDLSYGFGFLNGQQNIHSSEHSAEFNFTRTMSRDTSLQIYDTFRSAVNDYGFSVDSAPLTSSEADLNQELYVPRRRLTTNSLSTTLNYRSSRRSNIGAFATYDLWDYNSPELHGTHGFQIGVRGSYQITSWLFLDSKYSSFINAVDKNRNTNIQRFDIGSFRFQPRRSVSLFVSGGMEFTNYQGVHQTTASAQGGISYQSRYGSLSLTYHRGFATAIGPGIALSADTLGAAYSQWLSRRINVQIASGYTRGTALVQADTQEYLTANAQIGVVIQRHTMLSAHYWYISQRGANLPVDTPTLKRYTVALGLQYFLPSLGRR
jgi:hypothetical protein